MTNISEHGHYDCNGHVTEKNITMKERLLTATWDTNGKAEVAVSGWEVKLGLHKAAGT